MLIKYGKGNGLPACIRRLLFTACIIIFPVFLNAQTAAEMDSILESPAVTCAQAARFVLASAGSGASGDVSDAIQPEADFEQAKEKGWFSKRTTPDESITLGKLSLLIMKAFDIKGGMMYALFPVPRYAFRTMVSRSFIQGASDPAMKVNGERFFIILGNVLSGTETAETVEVTETTTEDAEAAEGEL